MGGSLIHREPTEALLLEAYDNIREIIQQVRLDGICATLTGI
jgi:hypothetical protein